jgi:transposase
MGRRLSPGSEREGQPLVRRTRFWRGTAGCCSAAGPPWREDRQTLRELFALNRRLAKAYLLRDQLTPLWTYTYEGWARRFLTTWLRALRWPRRPAFQKLGRLLTRHLDGILNYCHEKVPFGTVEAINRNIRAMLRRGRGYRDHEYLLLKVQRATATRRLQQAA